MIELFSRLLGAAQSGPTEPLIRLVTEASIAGVCERVAPQVDTMTLSEARGYVRARASAVVRRQTQLALRDLPEAPIGWANSIARAATERLVPIVLRQTGVGVPRAGRLAAAA